MVRDDPLVPPGRGEKPPFKKVHLAVAQDSYLPHSHMGEIILADPTPSPERRQPDVPRHDDAARPPTGPSSDADLELDFDALLNPIRAGAKRPLTAINSDDEDEPDNHGQLLRSLTKQLHLDTSNGLELERFTTLSRAEQLIMLMATVLALKQRSAAQAAATTWTIPAELESNIAKYASAFAFSANCRGYKKWAPETVLAAMRAGKVALPADSDVGRLEKVTKRISDKLTDYRADLKRKIKDCITTKADIATLAADVVRGTGVKLTVEFYHRLAWLRHFGPKVDFERKVFWNDIDDLLEKIRGKFTGDKYTAHFKSIYRKDIEAFGSETVDVAIVASSDLPEHQRLVEKTATNAVNQARKRVCLPRQATAPRASSSASTPSAD